MYVEKILVGPEETHSVTFATFLIKPDDEERLPAGWAALVQQAISMKLEKESYEKWVVLSEWSQVRVAYQPRYIWLEGTDEEKRLKEFGAVETLIRNVLLGNG